MAEENAVVEQPTESKAEAPQSAFEKASKIAESEWSRLATEEASDEQPAAEGVTEPPDGSAPVAEEPKPVESEKFEVTAEQLADTKFWGGLDKAGWERMEKAYPVQTALVKAAQAAGTRIVNEARKTTQPPAQTANDKPTETHESAELQDAISRANSLDEKVAAKGLQDIIRLTLKETLPEFGLDPAEAKATAVAQHAFASVIAEDPEIAKLDPKALDAAVSSNASLVNMLDRAKNLPDNIRIGITADVMRIAADSVKAKQKADAASTAAKNAQDIEKKKNAQRKVNSNASVVSNIVADSPGGSAPKGKKTAVEIVNEKWAEVAAREAQG